MIIELILFCFFCPPKVLSKISISIINFIEKVENQYNTSTEYYHACLNCMGLFLDLWIPQRGFDFKYNNINLKWVFLVTIYFRENFTQMFITNKSIERSDKFWNLYLHWSSLVNYYLSSPNIKAFNLKIKLSNSFVRKSQ